MNPGAHVDRPERRPPRAPHPELPLPDLDLHARLLQLEQHLAQVLGWTALQGDVAAGGGRRDRVGAGLQVVRDHMVLGAGLDAAQAECLLAGFRDRPFHGLNGGVQRALHSQQQNGACHRCNRQRDQGLDQRKGPLRAPSQP